MTNPVQHQLDAFLDAYAPDTRVEDGAGTELMSGAEEMRAFYGAVFENSPDLRCEFVDRTRVGDWIFDEEQIEGLHAEGFPEEAHAMVAYEVANGQIMFVRMFS